VEVDRITVKANICCWILGVSGGEWFVVYIDNRLLSEVNPEDMLLITVFL